MGRNKQSADEHRQSGTFRNDRHGSVKANEGILTVLPASPYPLEGRAAEVYAVAGEALVNAGSLKETDLFTLANFASEQAMYERCILEMSGEKLVIQLHTKVFAPNPLRKLAETAQKNALTLAAQLGMTPRARYAIKGRGEFGPQAQENDPLAALFGNN